MSRGAPGAPSSESGTPPRRKFAARAGAKKRYSPASSSGVDPTLERFLIRLGIVLVIFACGGYGATRSSSHTEPIKENRIELSDEEFQKLKEQIDKKNSAAK